MKKQKKREKKKFSELSEKDLRNRWIMISIGLLVLLLLVTILLIFFFRGKVNIPGVPSFARPDVIKDSNSGSSEIGEYNKKYINKYNNYDFDKFYQKQISKPKKDEEIAEIHLAGSNKTIKIKLFSEEAPELVKQFKTLVGKKYYDNKTMGVETNKIAKTLIVDESIEFDTISNDKSQLSDDVLKNIESWEMLEVKSHEVLPYKGAVCADFLGIEGKKISANFFIMNIEPNKNKNVDDLLIPRQLKELFKKYGGDPSFTSSFSQVKEELEINYQANLMDYMHHPTFGQVFEGQEIIDKITKTDQSYTIEKIEIINYKE